MGELVGLRARGFVLLGCAAVAGEEAAGQRAPGDDAHALRPALRDHLALFFAVDQVVVVLHRNELRPAVRFGHVLGLRELPGVHAGCADVERLACPHHIVQRLHRLLDRRVRVPAVDLVEVHVIRAEALERGIDALHHMLARKPAVVRVAAHRVAQLGGDDHLVALGQLLEGAAGDLFTGADRVDVRGVEEVDASIECALDERPGVGVIEDPVAPLAAAVGHHAETDARDFEAGLAQVAVLHCELLRLVQ